MPFWFLPQRNIVSDLLIKSSRSAKRVWPLALLDISAWKQLSNNMGSVKWKGKLLIWEARLSVAFWLHVDWKRDDVIWGWLWHLTWRPRPCAFQSNEIVVVCCDVTLFQHFPHLLVGLILKQEPVPVEINTQLSLCNLIGQLCKHWSNSISDNTLLQNCIFPNVFWTSAWIKI